MLRKQTHWKKEAVRREYVFMEILSNLMKIRAECSEEMGTVMARCNKRRGWGG